MDFCIGLVRFARLNAEDTARFGVKNWDSSGIETHQRNRISVSDLIQDVELGDEAYAYGETRGAKFDLYSTVDENDCVDGENPPLGFVSAQGTVDQIGRSTQGEDVLGGQG